MLGGATGRIYVLEKDKAAVQAGDKTVEPLVLHVNVGDCILLQLSNELETGPVSFHTDILAVDPKQNLGVEAGYNAPQVVMPGDSRLYTLYAHPEVGKRLPWRGIGEMCWKTLA
jgi:manganese oxidase